MVDDNLIYISLEEVINSLPMSNKEKEICYLEWVHFPKDKGKVVWEDNKIVGYRPYEACQSISLKIVVDKDKVVIE